MQHSKSYMVPKMIFANVLAVIMMTFEQHAPAELKQKPQRAVGDQPSQQAPVLKVSITEQVEVAAAEAQAVPKKRMYKTGQPAKHHARPQLVHAPSAPIDCCFRGYKS